MNTIKAIETRYKGYRFRSRLEARWAVFLDSFGEKWGYEVEGYSLPSGCYLPDFWLPRLNCWLEIKGQLPTESEEQLCSELAHMTGKPIALAWDLPFAVTKCRKLRTDGGGESRHYLAKGLKVFCGETSDGGGSALSSYDDCFWAIGLNGRLCICANHDRSSRMFWTPWLEQPFPAMQLPIGIIAPISEKRADVAKAARFEYGNKCRYKQTSGRVPTGEGTA